MGRKPVGKKAMTAAERQRRRRKRLRSAKLKLGKKALRQKKLLEAGEQYIPTPPGVTYWRRVTIRTVDGDRTFWQPTTRPLAAMAWGELTDADLDALREHLDREVRKRRTGRGLGGGGGVMEFSADAPA